MSIFREKKSVHYASKNSILRRNFKHGCIADDRRSANQPDTQWQWKPFAKCRSLCWKHVCFLDLFASSVSADSVTGESYELEAHQCLHTVLSIHRTKVCADTRRAACPAALPRIICISTYISSRLLRAQLQARCIVPTFDSGCGHNRRPRKPGHRTLVSWLV